MYDSFNDLTVVNTSRHLDYKKNFQLFLRILVVVTLTVIFIRVFWRIRGNDGSLSFTAFLDWLSNLNGFDISIGINSFVIGGDWGWFDGLRNFFNVFANLFGVIVWLFGNLINCLIYLLAFVQFLFV